MRQTTKFGQANSLRTPWVGLSTVLVLAALLGWVETSTRAGQAPSRQEPIRKAEAQATSKSAEVLNEPTQSATDNQPTDDTPTLLDARDLLMSGRYEQAMAAFVDLERNEEHPLKAAIGVAACRERLGQYEEGIEALESLQANDSAAWHMQLARLLVHKGSYDEALQHAGSAIKLDKTHAGARRFAGELLEMLGRRAEALHTYRWFDRQVVSQAELPRDAEHLTDLAVGFLRYSVLTQTHVASRTKHVLREMLQPAYSRVDRRYWPARIAAAELLRERYNNDENDGSVSDYRAALKINEHLAEAHIGLGEVQLEGWQFARVEQHVEQALAVNPRDARALHLLARKLIIERRYQQAIDTCQRVLETNPNDLQSLALQTSALACQFDQAGVDRVLEQIQTINPRSAMVYRTLGTSLSGIRQYEASERAFLRAVKYEPTDANAYTALGMMYMQWGLEDKARDALDRSWTLDPFNKRTKFTLDLLDSLQKFATSDTEHFTVRYNAETDPGLGPYVAEYLETIYEPVTQDFDTALEHKTMIELFPSQRAFAVRITGQPWIHTVGACTGRVIALAAPRDDPGLMGTYDLGRVLKHEFTHTVTLAATHNRIPHWFTEGLAVMSEDAPRSFAWWTLLAEAARRSELFTLESINWGFVRPQKPTDRQLAYAQGEWMCLYIAERFGYQRLLDSLGYFREGRTQQETFTTLFEISPETFHADFVDWAKKQLLAQGFDLTPPEDVETLRELAEKNPEDDSTIGRLAKAELDAGEHARSLEAARRALTLNDNNITALDVRAKVLAIFMEQTPSPTARKKYENEALASADKLQQLAPDNWAAARVSASILLRREQYDRAIEALQRLQEICPLDPLSWRGLAGIYLKQGKDDLAIRQLQELVRTDQRDADLRKQIATIFRRKGQLRDALYWYRQAVLMAPLEVELHEALGDTAMQLSDFASALSEYVMLTELAPKKALYFERAAFAANRLGQKAEAARFASQAVKLDPSSEARSLLPLAGE